jgi:glycosyltransferase involved in cell wall biosynthesis
VSQPDGALLLAYRLSEEQIDSIRDYTMQLAAAIAESAPALVVRTALGAAGGDWELTDVRTGALTGAVDFRAAVADAGAACVLTQYNPFSYGRWGIAPWLPLRLAQLKRSGVRVALMCHEVYVPLHSPREAMIALPQRLQIAALGSVCDVVLVSTEAAGRQVHRWAPRVRIVHVQVGSNLPDARGERARTRSELGVGDEELVLATFGTAHPSRRLSHLAAAIDAVAAVAPVCVLNLGAGAPALELGSGVRVLRPGELEAAALAAQLAAADLCLLAYIDGVSTRRTTLASALQQELCVIASDGYNTDAMLRDAHGAICLTAAGSVAQFAAAAVRLALDSGARKEQARRGRELFERTFAWAPIAARVLAALDYAA